VVGGYSRLKNAAPTLALVLCCLFPAAPLCSLDFSLRPRGFAFVPLGEYSRSRYSAAGGGGELLFDMELSSLLGAPGGLGWSLGAGAGYGRLGLATGAGGNLELYSAGLGASLFAYPFSRIMLRAEAAAGYYGGVMGEGSSSYVWWSGGGEAGFRFTPSLILSLSGGWRQYHNPYDIPPLGGIYAGVGVQFNLETRSPALRGIEVQLVQDEPVFPVFQSLYRQNPVGTLRITNRESSEIRDLRVSFRAGNYSSSEFDCGSVPVIQKGRTVEIPLYADFSPEILNLTEKGRIVGELVLRYRLLGAGREAARGVAVEAHHRNSFRWADPSALAAFVSPTAPEILEYAKYLSGIARGNLRTGLNRNMQSAIWLFEGLRAGNLGLSEIPETPYAWHRADPSLLDTVQFPFQTLAYRSGGEDDLGLLYAAVLEAAGIKAAFLPLDDEFITAFALGLPAGSPILASLFNGGENLLTLGDEVWLPLAFSAFDGGFGAAWRKAAARLLRLAESGEEAELIIPEYAWQTYPPALLPVQEARYLQPEEGAVKTLAEGEIEKYLAAELAPKAASLEEKLRTGPSPELYNRLGNLYIRMGKTADAERAYTRAAASRFVPAMVNLGNLYMLQRNYVESRAWFSRALAQDPDNGAAKRGLEQAAARLP
jgi:tetratricopeptide (TPR) repeat protein